MLGLAYKENTHSTKNSPAIALLERLRGHTVRVHDPVVPPSVVPWAVGVADPLDAADGADALVVATPWPIYRDLDLDAVSRRMRGRLLVDPYGMLAAREPSMHGLDWRRLGAPAATGARR